MKQYKRLVALMLLLLMLPACKTNTAQPVSESSATETEEPSSTDSSENLGLSSKYIIDENGIVMNYIDTLDIIYEEDDNYVIYTDEIQSGYQYYVKNDDGALIDEGFHTWRGSFGFDRKDGILVLDNGFGGPSWHRRYYDTASGRVSRFFYKPVQTSNELVAYFTSKGEDATIVLVVQNMFDPAVYYKEFQGNFSGMVFRDHSTGEFLDNDTKLKVHFWTEPNDEEATEIFDLT